MQTSFLKSLFLAALLPAAPLTPPAASLVPAPTLPVLKTPRVLTLELSKAKSLYYAGNLSQALGVYQRALKPEPRLLSAWLNGATILEELGKNKEAARWYLRAAAINPDSDIETALASSYFRTRRFKLAQKTFSRALSQNPQNAEALFGTARVEIAWRRPHQALFYLKKAAKADPPWTLVPYYEGKVYEGMKNRTEEIASYRQASIADSYFLEARQSLGRAYLQKGAYPEALAQFQRIQRSEPRNPRWDAALQSISQMRPQGFSIQPSRFYHWLLPLFAKPLPSEGVPILRIGIGTSPLGRPRKRSTVAFYVTAPFDIKNFKGELLAHGNANQIWVVNLKKKGWRRFLSISGPPHFLIKNFRPLIIAPETSNAMIKLESPSKTGEPGLAKVLRGQIEFAVFKRNLRIVNIIDLENYVQGVLASEMPIRSPIEALKAQAILARSEALFLKKIWRRHRKQGYDLCDAEHCQVYKGVYAESRLARRIVEETKGQVIVYKGRLAHGIYSADCGGHTQSGGEVSGWGKTPYWKGISDGGKVRNWPLSPWKLKQWLNSWPSAFCQPSRYVYPSHYRWSRVISMKSLSQKISRRFHLGRLKSVIPLKRAVSGNVNSVMLIGTRRRVIIRDELKIRSLLGVGPLRSTLFTLNEEYDSKGHVKFLFFRGGGWGHGVGMCQSGAMGRAKAGQNYQEIISSYFPGVQIKTLDYSIHK